MCLNKRGGRLQLSLLRGHCKLATLKTFFVVGQIAVTRPSRVHFKCHRNVIVSPDSCERHRRRGRNREFHLLLSEARRETRAPPSERSASSLTDHWYLGSKRNGNESKSGGIIIPSERFSICHKRRSPGLGNFPPRIYGEHKKESYAIFSFLRDERQVGGSSSRLEGVGGGPAFFHFSWKAAVCPCVSVCMCALAAFQACRLLWFVSIRSVISSFAFLPQCYSSRYWLISLIVCIFSSTAKLASRKENQKAQGVLMYGVKSGSVP